MSGMARLKYGRLSEAWKGEASDFTPLLAEQVDALGAAIGVDLATIGKSEVVTSGNRRIDILATDSEGSEFVIENQYRGLDHDHLTRGLAYAVARRARGLVVVAEEHRDEFRALAQYLNDLAELDTERGISVWLVEAKAVQIEDSPWAPLFDVVIEPNSFTAIVEQTKQAETALSSLDELLSMIESDSVLKAVQEVVQAWDGMGHRRRLGPNHVVLEARGPSKNGFRTVVAIYADGRVMVPFGSYAGQNSGIEIAPLTTAQFRTEADGLFGFAGSEKLARTTAAWLTPERTARLLAFCTTVADAYKAALETVLDAGI
jgi:hypothetical protein